MELDLLMVLRLPLVVLVRVVLRVVIVVLVVLLAAVFVLIYQQPAAFFVRQYLSAVLASVLKKHKIQFLTISEMLHQFPFSFGDKHQVLFYLHIRYQQQDQRLLPKLLDWQEEALQEEE